MLDSNSPVALTTPCRPHAGSNGAVWAARNCPTCSRVGLSGLGDHVVIHPVTVAQHAQGGPIARCGRREIGDPLHDLLDRATLSDQGVAHRRSILPGIRSLDPGVLRLLLGGDRVGDVVMGRHCPQVFPSGRRPRRRSAGYIPQLPGPLVRHPALPCGPTRGCQDSLQRIQHRRTPAGNHQRVQGRHHLVA